MTTMTAAPTEDPACALAQVPISSQVSDPTRVATGGDHSNGTRPSVTDLGDQIVSFAGRLASSMCRWLLLIAEFDAVAGHERYGMSCTASWLGHWCGVSRRTAAEHVRVARALAREPALARAMDGGRLSYSQVRAISRIAEPGGRELVSMLINVAENGTVAQLESVIAGLRTVDDHDPSRAPELPREYLRSAFDEGSHWRLSGRIAPEDGALIDAALAQVVKSLLPQPAESGNAESGQRPTQVRALIKLAELGLAALAEQEAPSSKPEPRGREQAAVVIHVDADRLPGEGAHHRAGTRPPSGRLQGGPGLPDRVVQKLLCDGRIRTVVEHRWRDGHRTPLDLGRSRRLVSARLFLALLIRDGGCRRPGCGSTRDLHAHHIKHWLFGGQTNLDNLVLLCAHCHSEHHEGRLSIEKSGLGQFSMRFRDEVIPAGPALARIVQSGVALEDEHEHVVADAARGKWTGERLDRPYAVATAATIRRLERQRLDQDTIERRDAVA